MKRLVLLLSVCLGTGALGQTRLMQPNGTRIGENGNVVFSRCDPHKYVDEDPPNNKSRFVMRNFPSDHSGAAWEYGIAHADCLPSTGGFEIVLKTYSHVDSTAITWGQPSGGEG
jgi:hypothetical protein